jgi:hypothetical protein
MLKAGECPQAIYLGSVALLKLQNWQDTTM